MKRRRIHYTPQQLLWVQQHSDMPRREMADVFARLFGRTDVTADHLKSLCTRNGWSAGPAGRSRNRGKSLIFTPEHVRWLTDNADLSRADVHAAFSAAFPAAGITLEQIIGFRKRNGIRTGRTGRFEKGQEPWSKGRKLPFNPNSAKTQFRKGQEPHNTKHLGHERMTKDGYVEISVKEVNPYTGYERRYVHKHRYLWEQANGPVPEGMALKCLDGDKTNTDPENWECIPRAMLPRLNGIYGRGYDEAPQELKPLILATTKLEHRARETKKDRKHG